MSFLHTKTNYVRPHPKASYIRPLCGYTENETTIKESVNSFDESVNYTKSPAKDSDAFSKKDSLKCIDEVKEKGLQSLSSAHSKLYDEIDKIQTWRASIELETKQKNKKLGEMSHTIESQKKVVLDLQMQNENLSLQLSEEIQKRASVLEKFYITKELCSTLRKKFNDLQGQTETCHKIKEAVTACIEENSKAIEDLKKKFNTMCMEYSEKNTHLNDALKNEKHNNLVLKDLCEQQNLNAEKQSKSFCKIIENYQEELNHYVKDLNNEKNKLLSLEQEKKELLQNISYVKNCNEDNLKKLKDTEEQLKLTIENKLEIEKMYESETIKVDKLNKKCEELEGLIKTQSTEFEETCLVLKTTISSLEKCVSEVKQKLKESECINEELSVILKERGEEKSCLENQISDIKKENEELKDKLKIDGRISDEITSQLMGEKNILNNELKLIQEELQKILSDKENLTKLYAENDKKLSLITSDYEAAVSKIEELSTVEEKYNDILKKVVEMEANMQMNSELLALKDLHIEEMQDLKVKYDGCLNNIRELEESVKSKSEELELKDLCIEEMQDFKVKYDDCLNNIRELEESVKSKSEELELKNIEIKELSNTKQQLLEATSRIKELESDILSKNELLVLKEENINELNAVEQNYTTMFEKIKDFEHDIKLKSELLDEKERKISDLNGMLKEKELKFEKLEYDYLEIKDTLMKEKESVKICLECEMMENKVKELENLKNVLMNTERELENQRQRASYNMKLLGESEDNYDEMRIKKEKEIIKCNDTIQSLQHQLRMLKVEVKQVEKLRTENEKLQMNIEELKLQNTGDIQRLKTEYEKQRIELDALRANNNLPLSDFEVKKMNKQLEHSVSKTELQKKPFQRNENENKMEADSSNEEITLVKQEMKPKCTNYKRFSREVNRKVSTIPKQSTPLTSEKRKREWESESSGSECLEIIFDKNAKKVGFTPKGIKPTEPKKSPLNSGGFGRSTSQDQKRDILTTVDEEIPSNDKSIKSKTVISFSTKSPGNKQLPVVDDTFDEDFLKCTESNAKVNHNDSPWMKRNADTKKSPSTPGQRKFFKTPMNEREFPFRKPQSQNLWF